MIREQYRVFGAGHSTAGVCCSADVVLNAVNSDNSHLLFPHWCSCSIARMMHLPPHHKQAALPI